MKQLQGMTVVSTREEELAKAIVAAAYAVHKTLGPGLLESIYEALFLPRVKQTSDTCTAARLVMPLVYDGLAFSEGLRLDVLVDDLVMCELKCVDSSKPCISGADHFPTETNRQTPWVSDQFQCSCDQARHSKSY